MKYTDSDYSSFVRRFWISYLLNCGFSLTEITATTRNLEVNHGK